MNKIAVLGAGSWGTALAQIISDNGYPATLWVRNNNLAQTMATTHLNTVYLPQLLLNKNLSFSSDLESVLKEAEVIFLVVPTHGMRDICKRIAAHNNCEHKIIISCSKGFEIVTNRTMSAIITEYLPLSNIAVLSGPNHAEEIAEKKPAASVIASSSVNVAKSVQTILLNSYFRPYISDDVLGVELAGSVKNIIALAAGMAAGLKLGDNCQAALLTRGMSEITRLGCKLGAKEQTFFGLAGMGDLIATCTSTHSRNRRAGLAIARGDSPKQITINNAGMVVEGFNATKAVYTIAKKLELEMPITNSVYNIIYKKHSITSELETLMERSGKTEYFF
ncbi:MAG TPA: NAD(P)-dependent glycerol-3-phosphate dehydrogenase [Candidatus Avacidaminococcus intestinavium]|uniref:Glycerol-3-phosphate dehydrogenase [NAD(P)+] n=1 Tax=Candidatus Avacidaminococcus intestinavium TaxID=2840684 RepID=A0A9D1SKW2_9FIRM|nr:NAD(P)-dependent glycerol-3-phosphate dehydrogenase [Candidatus Avacidaminococcus intestinavium]